ncbi:hypothetical protein NCCP2165_12260 [Halomonas sp. NCCP-2165]|nr:hypothetical protein NCCP2165_12260 [Halomonas sp. NCCP-2165]
MVHRWYHLGQMTNHNNLYPLHKLVDSRHFANPWVMLCQAAIEESSGELLAITHEKRQEVAVAQLDEWVVPPRRELDSLVLWQEFLLALAKLL